MLWSQPHGDGSESTTRLMLGRRCLQIGPDILKSVCSVVGHFLLSVELSFQLGNMKRCLDAVADGLQPSYFSSCHKLLLNTLLSKLGRVFSFLLVTPAFLHTVLLPELFSCLAKVPALLVFLASTLASIPVVCCLGRKQIL